MAVLPRDSDLWARITVIKTDTQGRNPMLVAFFVAFQFVGLGGLLITLTTALLSPKIKRHSTWYSFCASWIASTISYTLLTFAGEQTAVDQPGFDLCLIQSGLLYAAPALTALTTLALVIQLWFSLNAMLSKVSIEGVHRRTLVLLIFPYLVATGAFVMTVADGATHPDAVRRSNTGVYCIITTGVPGHTSAVLVAITMLATIAFEAMICHVLWKNWKAFRGLGARSRQSLAMIVRVGIFTFFGILSIAVCLIMLSNFDSPIPNIFIALFPVVSVLVFSTQMDLVRVWMFWKTYTRPRSDSAGSVNSSGPLNNSGPPVPEKTAALGYM